MPLNKSPQRYYNKELARLELKTMDLNDIKELEGKNALVIISNGQMKAAELPKFGIVEITSHDEKVTFVEQKIKSKF